jgi:hypothetical protein
LAFALDLDISRLKHPFAAQSGRAKLTATHRSD